MTSTSSRSDTDSLFEFERTYILQSTNLSPPIRRFAIGVRSYEYQSPNPGEPPRAGLIMLSPGSQHGFGFRTLQVSKLPNGKVRALDADETTEGGAPIVWVFEPLTLANWRELAKVITISGFEVLQTQLTSDADVQNFYNLEFLYPYWREAWERDQAGGKTDVPDDAG